MSLILFACTDSSQDTGEEEEEDVTPRPPCEESAVPMVEIPAGTFRMGSSESEIGHDYEASVDDEEALHEVTLTSAFCLGITEVTREQFADATGYDPERQDWECASNCPAGGVNWHMAAAAANLLSDRESLDACYDCTIDDDDPSETRCTFVADPYTCGGYRHPTEAEWEYAARAGSGDAFGAAGNLLSEDDLERCERGIVLSSGEELDDHAWYCGTRDEDLPYPVVGELLPNPWGLYDTLGYQHEWVADGVEPYGPAATDPFLDAADPDAPRRIRGGATFQYPGEVRAACRGTGDSTLQAGVYGFRLARTR